jgi:flagellar hook-associated protein 1 FlgK
MSLSGALQIGRSALLASQAAIEIAGQNLANAATPGYHRQRIELAPSGDRAIQRGLYVGTGVKIADVSRAVDEALESRIRSAVSDQQQSIIRQELLVQIEAIENELSGHDLSTHLDNLFNAFSDLALRPRDFSLRSLVIEQSKATASYIQNIRSDFTLVRDQLDDSIDHAALRANELLSEIERINKQIALVEQGTGGSNSLRDERTALLGELSELVDISTVEQPSGMIDVFVGSTPLVLNGQSRGFEVRRTTKDGELRIDLVTKADQTVVRPRSGRLGALIGARTDTIDHTIKTLDDFAGALVFQVNRVHSQGQPLTAANSYTGDYRVDDADAALNSADANLAFTPGHGSFQVHLTQAQTGERLTTTINIDLDGVDAGNDTTLNDLVAALDAVDNLTASVTPDGRLRIAGETQDFHVSFSDDSSGVLAALGINTFFKGQNASDIAVTDTVNGNPSMIAAGLGHVDGDNRNALALSDLRDRALDDLNGLSLTQTWRRHVEDIAVRASQMRQDAQADAVVLDSLQAQFQAVSGVNTDEEAINLVMFQRTFQASARFLNVVSEMMGTLMELV